MSHLCRVLQQPDGSLIIIHPAMYDQGRTEPDDEVWARLCLDKTLTKHPEWRALTATDMLDTALPVSRAKRAGWRLVAGAVVEDEAAFQAAQTTERVQHFESQRLVKALAVWTSMRVLGRTPTVGEREQARDEILAIYRGLP